MMKALQNKLKRNKKFTALVLGLLSVAALPPYYQFYVLFITLSGLFILTEKAEKGSKAFAVGYWFGFGFFSLGFSWVGNALLIDTTTSWLYPICLISAGLFFGLFTAIPTYLSSKFKSTYMKFVCLCTLLVISEWIRSFILTGFPWNQFGSVLAFDIRLIQSASIFGTYGLSLFVILTCSALGLYLVEKDVKSGITAAAIILIITFGIFSYGNRRIQNHIFFEDSDVKVRIVQPSIPQKFKWDERALERNLKTYVEMSNYPGLEDVDFVIWGETASPYPLDMDYTYIEFVATAAPEMGYLITGSIRYEYNKEDKKYQPANSLFVINREGGIEEYYDKHHLVPFGEYIPLKKYLPEWIKPVTKVVANFYKGDGNKTISLDNYPKFGPLICYEIIFPSEVVNRNKRPEWLINVTNDGWYGDSMGPYQHLVTTQLRAVEEGIAIVRVANTGISALISYTGEVLDKIPLNKSDILDVYLPKNLSTTTIYGKYPNYLILILFIANILMLLMCKKPKK